MKMIRTLTVFVAVMGIAWAQAVTGGMFGSVTDSSGAAIERADIKLVSITTGAERTFQTTHAGEFVIDGLEPGEYTISVTAPGFKTSTRKGIQLSPSDRLALGAFSLQVGGVDQQVTVTAEGATVQTASGERSASISAAQTEELPV